LEASDEIETMVVTAAQQGAATVLTGEKESVRGGRGRNVRPGF
jgi:hypothetical protein